ncbi:MAG TPA: hypothetical protein DCE42_12040 [Myxococcales bacterium]|nr:hypothetical protein [Deltaproteobacteria bacterium]MBU47958.1 hypothetical protein [Deltaproteobacteria bacterium]HAA55481.1 hypothetical protein [Myxococcales bacterium]|tara:strand:+ start:12045 stop:12857 length:813 start_codon:yes stop_codon:yes gene_type:complete
MPRKQVKKKSKKTSTRDVLLDAVLALREETEKAPHELTLNDVSERAGVSRMTLYRHFPTKQSLLESVREERGIEFVEQEDVRARILRAVREVLVKEGFSATMEVIAEKAGVGVATLYRQFGDKASLIGAFREHLRPSEILSELALSESEDVEADLSTFATRQIAVLQQHQDLLLLAIRAKLNKEEGTDTLAFSGVTIRALEQYFSKQLQAGRIAERGDSPRELAVAFVGAMLMSAWFYPTMSGEPPDAPERIGARVARIFVHGIQGESHE